MPESDKPTEIEQIMGLLEPTHVTPTFEDPPVADYVHTDDWFQYALRHAERTDTVTLTLAQMQKINTDLHVGEFNTTQLEAANGILDRIIKAVSGVPAVRSMLESGDLPAVIDSALVVLSGQMVLSVAGLNALLPSPLTTAEGDQLRNWIPSSSIRDAFCENAREIIEQRRDELAEAIPPFALPSQLAGAFQDWNSLNEVPSKVIGAVLATLSQFCGMRIVRVSVEDRMYLHFEDPTGIRFYYVEGDLLFWLLGRRKSAGLPANWVGDPIHEILPSDLIKTGMYDYALPSQPEQVDP
ncbi:MULTISPECIES: hypothetical protein [Nocardia]|uniref:hypothetical protein n=1 Tax=Nocardia TaxID=1817 RepID=UPI000D68F2C0|nr:MULTISPECIES: hypothetical protein [Nocardia]